MRGRVVSFRGMTTTSKVQTWTNIDKTDWPDGPWQHEPDKATWYDPTTRMACMIRRVAATGALCGYVGVEPDHPAHGKGYDEVDAHGHGGLTFAGACQESNDPGIGICHVPDQGRTDDVWWLGFDCAHAFDRSPAIEQFLTNRPYEGDVYRTFAYVEEQTTLLAAQLQELADA